MAALSHGMQPNARTGRVTQTPKRLALRADKRIGGIPGNTVWVHPHRLQQLVLPRDWKAIEITTFAFLELRSKLLSRFDFVKRSLDSRCPTFRAATCFRCFCPRSIRSRECISPFQRCLAKSRIALSAGAIGIAPLSHWE